MQQHSTGSTVKTLHILTLCVLAFGIRAYLWFTHSHVVFLHEADAMGYISIARNIIENFSISNATHFPPFYPSLIAIFSLIAGNYETGARYASIVLGSAMVVPFYLAAAYLMPARAAFCAALFAACFAPFVDYSLQPVSQATYMSLIAFGVWIGLRCITAPTRSSLALFGAASAAIYLTRPEGIVFFALNLPLLLYVIATERLALKHRLGHAAVLAGSFFLPFVWYVVNLKRFTGSWSISGKSGLTSIGIDASMKLLPGGKTYGEMAVGTAGLADLIPGFSAFITTYLTQLGKFATVALSSLPAIMVMLAVIGAARLAYELFRTGDDTARLRCWMFLSPLGMLLPVMAFDKISTSAGYILPFFMVLLCLSAKAIVWLEEAIMEWLGKCCSLPVDVRRHLPLAVIASIVFSGHLFMPLYQWLSSDDFRFMSGQQEFLLRQTGHWFRANSDKSSRLMARWSNIGYYGDRSWIGLADGSISEVTEYARRNRINYIVIDSDAVPRRRPQLEALLNPTLPHSGLTPVYAEQQFETRVIIYRVH